MEPHIVEVYSLRWLNAENTVLGGEVKFSHREGRDPVCITANYDTQIGRRLWSEANHGLHGEIAPYVPPKPLTPDELRAKLPALTPREFRDILIDNNIMPDDVTAEILRIPDLKTRAKTLNAWEYPVEFNRTDPHVDIIGAGFGLSPLQIDKMWSDGLKTYRGTT